MLPLWLFTLGREIYSERDITIPFTNIITTLFALMFAICVGLVLQWKLPKVAQFFIKAMKYVIVVFIIFVFSVGIYANWFIFLLISWDLVIAAACLPYLGFIFGGIVSYVLRQPKENVIAIAVETGIQNTGIPIVLLQLSLAGPEKNTSIVAPVVSAIFTPIPLVITIVVVKLRAWWKRRQMENQEWIDAGNDENGSVHFEYLDTDKQNGS